MIIKTLSAAIVTLSFCFFALSVHANRSDIVTATGNSVGHYANSYALLVGVSDYDVGWPDLDAVPSELQNVEALLLEQGFSVAKVMNPDSDQLQEAFENFVDLYGYSPNNRLLFYYSGHGYSRAENTKGYLVPTDAPNPQKDERGFIRKAYSIASLLALARQIESHHALFLFDSCFSGTIFKTRALPTEPLLISQLTALPVRQFITAGQAGEVVPAKSTFTPAFIDSIKYGLADLNSDGYVTGSELGMHLQSVVSDSSYGGQTPQYGKINDYELARGDFVFGSGAQTPLKKASKTQVAIKTEEIPKLVLRAEEGDALAQARLGIIYSQGKGVAVNYEEGEKWSRLAAEQGLAIGEFTLGLILVGGYLDIPKKESFREGVGWLTLAAKQGYPKAQLMLGLMYHVGRGVKKNDLDAFMWVSVASTNGEKNRDQTSKIKARLTRDQIEDAQEKATMCIKSEYEVC